VYTLVRDLVGEKGTYDVEQSSYQAMVLHDMPGNGGGSEEL
jgi:hypothetical protein